MWRSGLGFFDMRAERNQQDKTILFPGIGAYQWRSAESRLIWTEELARLYGLDALPDGVGFDAFVHPEDRQEVVTGTYALLTAGGSYAREFRIVRADGEVRHIHDRGVVERGKDRSPILKGVHIDVTPHRRAMAPPNPAAIDFREVAESLPQMVWSCNSSGACDYLSPQWAAYTGAPKSEQLGYGWLDRLHPEDRGRAMAHWRDTVGQGRNFATEFRIRRHDGAYRWFRTLAVPLRDPSGQTRKWFGSNTDIEDLKRAEAALRESEAFARARAQEIETLYNAAPIGLVLFDRDFRFVRVNERLAEFLRRPADGIVGKRMEEVLSDVAVDMLRAVAPRLNEGEEVAGMEVETVDPQTGRARTYVVNYRPQRGPEGAVTHFLGTVQDITDRKGAEDALAESEARFRGVFENAATGVAIKDLDGRFVSCNPAYAAMVGYPAEALVGLPFSDLVHPEDRPANLAEIARLVAGEIPAFETENRYLHRDGAIVWVRKHASLLRDARGRPTHIIALVTDTSERKRHEARQQVLLHELNHRAKNSLALIQGVARQTAARSPGDFLPRFEQRLQAIASAQDLLVRNDWRKAEVRDLLASQLAHFGGLDERVSARGEDVAVTAPAAQTLGMAFHELATNAAKYGALSTEAGRIDVAWSLGKDPDGQEIFQLEWVESGGPAVGSEPLTRGFGSTLVERLVRSAFGGEVEYAFAVQGVSWRLRCPASSVVMKD